MRVGPTSGDFQAMAIAGTRAVMIALNCEENFRHGLLGFAFKREIVGAGSRKGKWLRSLKVFESLVPDPKNAKDPNAPTKPQRFSTLEHPIQSFLWTDYTAEPDTLYRFTIVPMYGEPKKLEPHTQYIRFEIRTEPEFSNGHGVWFNRGAIASQAFAREFNNKAPGNKEINDPEAPETRWLSRGLLNACLKFIEETPSGDGLRVAAYEFTYAPILNALKAAIDRGVDVRIIYHDTRSEAGKTKNANEDAIQLAGIKKKHGSKQVLYPRAKTKIPHNKFIVRLKGGSDPTMVWTGSTNFTPSGFLGQSNVGHLVEDAGAATTFLKFWELLKKDPDQDTARAGVMKLTPNPPEVVPKNSTVLVFSPRPKSDMLKWYGRRIDNATGTVMFTAAFGVSSILIGPFAKNKNFLRFILMEKPLTQTARNQLKKDRDLKISYGSVLGEMYAFKNGKPTARRKIKDFELDKWLLEEDHYRHSGFVFFVHTKFLLIDPLSNDPLVCTGSANFSANSLLANDENMLIIRGNTRVADIYMTEFDRLFRHFYFRDVANECEAKGNNAKGAFLSETDSWTESYFTAKSFKTRRREMFFTPPKTTWVDNAAAGAGMTGKKLSSTKAKPSSSTKNKKK